ncbi:MAG: hypothetical protein GC181_03130 [Bacteroidetes bacterium]|nr:hypothetical protein [Bacteroidota bacterium]
MAKKSAIHNILTDPEFWAILIFNLIILYTFYVDVTSARSVIILYYLQSVLIGVQAFVRMVFRGSREKGAVPFGTRYGAPLFFALHYGLFHLVYFVFLVMIALKLPGTPNDIAIIQGVFLFMLLNMVMSLFSDVRKDKEEGKAAGGLKFLPYARIFPMHLFIIVGFNMDADGLTRAFQIFIGLKVISDLLMHVVINKTFLERRPKAVGGWI